MFGLIAGLAAAAFTLAETVAVAEAVTAVATAATVTAVAVKSSKGEERN